MNQFIKFPSINQFKDIIRHVNTSARYHETEVPKLKFTGTVKLHGTNAGVVCDHEGNWHTQSRERVIDPLSDNAGFATWCHGNKKHWDALFVNLGADRLLPGQHMVVFGEWCGGNIQKGVGVCQLPKMFVVFGIGVVNTVEVGEIGERADIISWRDISTYSDVFRVTFQELGNVFMSTDFKTYSVEIDFNCPTLSQNELVELTMEVEEDCPVARSFLPDADGVLVGEGIVWEIDMSASVFNPKLTNSFGGMRFKTKGEKHSASKVKTIAQVDETKVKNVNEFVEFACTENRLNQGLDKLTEMGLERTSKNTGEFIRWIMGDIIKEEIETLAASGLTTKDVTSQIASKARQFYMNVV